MIIAFRKLNFLLTDPDNILLYYLVFLLNIEDVGSNEEQKATGYQ
jgi:hypothetical protein